VIDNTNSLKTEEIEDDQRYIGNKRYLIEITDCDTEGKYYTKRIRSLSKAVGMAAEYNNLMGLTAVILDTKTGETI
jgi:hypothetical protein